MVVGPLRSTVSESVALLLGVRDTPQISYGSSSPTLSDKALYPRFFRTFPSDATSAITICQLLSDQLDLARVGVFYSARPSLPPPLPYRSPTAPRPSPLPPPHPYPTPHPTPPIPHTLSRPTHEQPSVLRHIFPRLRLALLTE